MLSTNFDNSLDIKPVIFEHDYCRSGDVRDDKDNAFGKKSSRPFDPVYKWMNRLINVSTGNDWNKIVDRETAILKVQYPFLPEEQLRGKAYKKFGIPTIMGGALSRTSAIFGGLIPGKLLKSRKKNERMSRYGDAKTLEHISQIGRDGQNQLTNRSSSSNEEIPPETEAPVPDTRRSSIGSDETESLTPNFQISNAVSVYSQPTQIFEQNTSLPDDLNRIYSATTQKLDLNFEEFRSRADIDDNLLGGFWSQCKIDQLNVPSVVLSNSSPNISSTEIFTEENIEIRSLHTDLNRNFLKSPFPRTAKSQSCPSRPTFSFSRKTLNEEQNVPVIDIANVDDSSPSNLTFSFPRKTLNRQQNVPVIDIINIDDSSRLATPNIGHFERSTLSEPQSSSVIQAELITEKYSPDKDTTEVVIKKAEQVLIKNELKRKRKLDRRAITSSEDKENDPVVINSQQKKLHAKELGLDKYAKNPSHFNDSLALVSLTQNLSLDNQTQKSGEAFSPNSASPEKKRRRLNFQVLPISRNKDCSSSPFPYHTTGESSVVFRNDPEKKQSSEVKLSTIAVNNEDVETSAQSSPDVVVVYRKQKASQKWITEKKRSATVIKDPTEKNGKAFFPENTTSEHKRRRLNFQVSRTFKTKDCRLMLPCERKKIIEILDLTQEDETNTTDESSVLIRNNPEEEKAAKLTCEVKLSTIASDDTGDVETAAKSSVNIDSDDRRQNAPLKTIIGENRSTIVIKDTDDKTSSNSTVISPTGVDKSSPGSTTDFSQSTSSSSTLLSDCCSGYDRCLQYENVAENEISVCKFLASFNVGSGTIHQQVDDILTFLEVDIAAD